MYGLLWWINYPNQIWILSLLSLLELSCSVSTTDLNSWFIIKIDFVLLVNASIYWVRYSCRHRGMKARCCVSLIFLPLFVYPLMLTANFAYAQHLNPRTLTLLSSSGYSAVFNTGFLMWLPLEIRLKSQVRRIKWSIKTPVFLDGRLKFFPPLVFIRKMKLWS